MAELNEYREGLEIPPARMRHLPVDHRGYPVPWFVQFIDGKPDFRIMDRDHLVKAHKYQRCWVCGGALGAYKTFTIGPMCAVNLVSAEPPSHNDCAYYSARMCPFLSLPKAKRREANMPEQLGEMAGIGIMRNPGVTLCWTTKSYRVERDGKRGVLFRIGPPVGVRWFACGRDATREEVEESIRTGLPILEEMATAEGPESVAALGRMVEAAMLLLPQAA